MLKWKNKAIYSVDEAKSIIRRVNKHMPKFAPLSPIEASYLKQEIADYNKHNKLHISLPQLISVRRLLSTQTAMYGRYNVHKYQTHLEDFFRKQKELNRPVTEVLAEAVTIFNIPPLDIVKQYLIHEGHDFKEITSALRFPSKAEKTVRDAVLWAIKNDSESAPNTQLILKES